MIYGYARVSTDGQTDNTSFDTQSHMIKREAEKYSNEHAFPEENMVEETTSGTVPPLEREGFRKIYDNIKEGDYLIVAFLDRLGRNNEEMLTTLRILTEKRIHIKVANMPYINVEDYAIDTPTALSVFMNAVMADIEKRTITQRMSLGRAKATAEAKEKGVRLLGRPDKYSQAQIDRALYLVLERGVSYRKAQEETGISKSTIGREVKRLKHKLELEARGESIPEYQQRDHYFRTIKQAEDIEKKREELKPKPTVVSTADDVLNSFLNLPREEQLKFLNELKPKK